MRFLGWLEEASPGDTTTAQSVVLTGAGGDAISANASTSANALVVSEALLSPADPTVVAFQVSGGTSGSGHVITTTIHTHNGYGKSENGVQKVK